MRNEPYNNQDDPTDPVRHSSAPQQGRQGDKLILGSFQDPSKRSERRPYQYPYSSYPQAGQQASPGGAYTPPQYPNTPGAQRNPYPQQGQMPPGTPQQRPRRRRKGCLITSLVVLLLVCIIGVLTISTAQRVLAFGSAISTQSPLSTQTSYMGTGDRVNLLVMGFGGSGHDGAYLTDSMLVMSLLPQSHHTTLISVPRDLWVQIPPGSGQYHKINAAYEYGSNNNAKPADGGNAAAAKISLVTGLDVKYWLTINFQGFREFIDSNMSLADLMQFALKMDLTNAHRVGLSNQNVLASGTAPDGEYILKPANGNWQAIVDYVKQQLYN